MEKRRDPRPVPPPHLEEMYGIEVSRTLISNVTDAVIEEVKLWQNRPLEELYPIVYLDALMVKVRDEGHIQNKAIYVVLGVNLEGQKEVLGLWVAQTEGAKFWLQVLTELQNRGVKDIFIACVDGLKGFPEAIEAVYPRTEVQLCIVHLVRASLNYVPWKARWPWISRVVIPRAYIEMILSSKPVQRVWPLATILGSNVALRSRGVSNSSSPKSPFRVFWLFPLRELPRWCPAGSCFS